VDIVVATPGRLWDLMQQKVVNLSRVEILILDEADQMLDMGFLRDLRKIVAQCPRDRQTLLFSATMPPEIREVADEWLRHPVQISVAPQGTPAERVQQSVAFVAKADKPRMLLRYLQQQPVGRALVFARTKHGADRLVKILTKEGVRSEAIHGNKSQNARQQALARFKSQQPPILVATDIAARGLDIDDVTHVINYDLPMTAELYVHRIGRTARAGAEGTAILFCDPAERGMLRQIEKLIKQKITAVGTQLPERTNEDHYEEAEREARPRHAPQHEQRRPRPAHAHSEGRETYGSARPPRRERRPAASSGGQRPAPSGAVPTGAEGDNRQVRLARRRRRRKKAAEVAANRPIAPRTLR
jgi:ATP-dependent RNA helicase RhlE